MCGSGKAAVSGASSGRQGHTGAEGSARSYNAPPPRRLLICGVVDVAACRCSNTEGDAIDEELPGVTCTDSDEALQFGKSSDSSSSTAAPASAAEEPVEEQSNIFIRKVKPAVEELVKDVGVTSDSVNRPETSPAAIADTERLVTENMLAGTDAKNSDIPVTSKAAAALDDLGEFTAAGSMVSSADLGVPKKKKPAAAKTTSTPRKGATKDTDSDAIAKGASDPSNDCAKPIKKKGTKTKQEVDPDLALKAEIERERNAPRTAKARGFNQKAEHNVETSPLEYKNGKLVIIEGGGSDSDTDDDLITGKMTATEKEIYYERKRLGVRSVPKQDCVCM